MRLWAHRPVLRSSFRVRCPGTLGYFTERETGFAAATAGIQPQVSTQHGAAGGRSKTGRADEHASRARYRKSGLCRPLPDSKVAPHEQRRQSRHFDHGDFQPMRHEAFMASRLLPGTRHSRQFANAAIAAPRNPNCLRPLWPGRRDDNFRGWHWNHRTCQSCNSIQGGE
jgi:hypothetical protein